MKLTATLIVARQCSRANAISHDPQASSPWHTYRKPHRPNVVQRIFSREPVSAWAAEPVEHRLANDHFAGCSGISRVVPGYVQHLARAPGA